MRIVGICGSPKSEHSSTRFLLEQALEATSDVLSDDIETVLLNIRDFNILHCTGCDSCVRKNPVPRVRMMTFLRLRRLSLVLKGS